MRDPDDWLNVDVSGNPLLVIGERPRPRQLDATVVDTHAEAHDILRSVATRATGTLAASEPVIWQPEAGIEDGEEYLVLESGDLLEATARHKVLSGLEDASELLGLLLRVHELRDLHPDRLREGGFLFYAIAFEDGDDGQPISFVRKWDPTSPLRGARAWFRFDGALVPERPPALVIQDQVDMVVTNSEIAILRPSAFNFLFSDIRATLADVPAAVVRLRQRMHSLPMTSAASDALVQACSNKTSYARRLGLLADSEAAESLDASQLKRTLLAHGEDPKDYLARGQLHITGDQVAKFLDVVEGRWYSADFTGERRRADRYRRR